VSEQQNRDAIERFFKAFERGDLDTLENVGTRVSSMGVGDGDPAPPRSRRLEVWLVEDDRTCSLRTRI
jgi:ketosteroid isomerase-like protein